MGETQKKGQESLKQTESEQKISEKRKRKDKCLLLEC